MQGQGWTGSSTHVTHVLIDKSVKKPLFGHFTVVKIYVMYGVGMHVEIILIGKEAFVNCISLRYIRNIITDVTLMHPFHSGSQTVGKDWSTNFS